MLSCIAFGIRKSCYRYQSKLDSENADIADWLIKLTDKESDWGGADGSFRSTSALMPLIITSMSFPLFPHLFELARFDGKGV